MNDEKERYATMREIGKIYSVSSHVIGRWLTRCGLREGGQPTDKAKQGGYSQWTLEPTREIWFWTWHVARTTAALEELIQECMGRKGAAIDREPSAATNCRTTEGDPE